MLTHEDRTPSGFGVLSPHRPGWPSASLRLPFALAFNPFGVRSIVDCVGAAGQQDPFGVRSIIDCVGPQVRRIPSGLPSLSTIPSGSPQAGTSGMALPQPCGYGTGRLAAEEVPKTRADKPSPGSGSTLRRRCPASHHPPSPTSRVTDPRAQVPGWRPGYYVLHTSIYKSLTINSSIEDRM